MNESEKRVKEPIEIPCPHCQAKVGQKCFEDRFGVYQHTFHNARIDAASRLPKAEVPSIPPLPSTQDCIHGCLRVDCPSCNPKSVVPPVAEPAPQTFEEWWYEEIRLARIHVRKNKYWVLKGIAEKAWNAAKGSVGCHAPDYKAGGDRGTQQKTSDSEAGNTAADRENLSSLSAEGSDVENIRQPPDSTDDCKQQVSVLSVSALSPAVDGGESEYTRGFLAGCDAVWDRIYKDLLSGRGYVEFAVRNECLAHCNRMKSALIKDVRGKE